MQPIGLAFISFYFYFAACLHGLAHRLAARWLTPRALRRPQALATLLRESVVWRNTIPISHACDVSPLAGAPRRSAVVALAGPAADLAGALLLIMVALVAPGLRIEALSGVGAVALFFLFEALPINRPQQLSDVALLRALARRDAGGRRIVALAALDRSAKGGRRPRDWHPMLLADATAPADGSRADAEAAARCLQRAMGGAARLSGRQRIVAHLEAAYVAGWLQRDAKRAGAELHAARAEAGGPMGREWRGVNRSLRGVPLRAAAAALFAAGEYEQAARTARQALLLPGRAIVRSGPTAADAGVCERDWLCALHDAATAQAAADAEGAESGESERRTALTALPAWHWAQPTARESRPPRWPWVLTIIALTLTLPSIGRLVRLTNAGDVDALALPLHNLRVAHWLGWGMLAIVCAALIVALLLSHLRLHSAVAATPLLCCAAVCLLGRAIGAQDVRYDGGYPGFLALEGDWLLRFAVPAACAALLALILHIRWRRRHAAQGAAADSRRNGVRWARLAWLGGWVLVVGSIAVGLLLVDLSR